MAKLADVIHIGFPKTATTWVQTKILPQAGNIACLGKAYMIDVRYKELLHRLVGSSELEFDPALFKEEFTKLNEENRDKIGNRPKLISFEFLSGEMYFGYDSRLLAERLKEVFGDVKIIITIREQRSMVESMYRHYILSGGCIHVRDFMYRPRSPAVDIWGNKSMFSKFRYDLLIKCYHDLFGKENVLVLPYEMIDTDRTEFFHRYFSFITPDVPGGLDYDQVSYNVGLSYLGCNILRYLNYLLATPVSSGPLLRNVCTVFYYRFLNAIFRPLDRFFISRISPNKKFIDKKRWSPNERLAFLIQRKTGLRLFKEYSHRIGEIDPGLTIRSDIEKTYLESNSNANTCDLTGLDLERPGYSVSRRE